MNKLPSYLVAAILWVFGLITQFLSSSVLLGWFDIRVKDAFAGSFVHLNSGGIYEYQNNWSYGFQDYTDFSLRDSHLFYV